MKCFVLFTDRPAVAPKKATKDIWEADEVQQGAEYTDDLDPRPEPEYVE